MSIEGKITNDMKDALKKREKVRLSTLRMLKSILKNKKKKKMAELTEDEEIKVINSYSKKLKDSLESYEKIKREDIVKGIKEEIKIVETYLPSPLSSEEITKIVSETIEEVGKDKKNMGQIMKKIMSKVNGRANGKEIKNLVQKSLEL